MRQQSRCEELLRSKENVVAVNTAFTEKIISVLIGAAKQFRNENGEKFVKDK
jgi:hypothetical protein